MTRTPNTPREKQPKRNSIVGRLLAYFEANPDEELTYADATIKLGARLHSVHCRVNEAVRRGDPIEVVTIIRRKRGGA